MIRIRGRVIIFFLFAIITLNFIILPARAASAVAGSGAAQNTSYAKAAANIQSAGSNPKIILAKIATKNDVSIKNITHSPLVLDRKNCAYEPVKGRTALHIQTDVRIAADYITFSRAVIDGDLYIESNNIFLKDLTIKGSIMVSPDSEGIMKLNNVTYSGIKIYEDNKADKRMQSFPEKSGRDGAGGTGGKGGADGAGAAGVTSTGKAGRAGFDMAGGIGTDKVSRAGADRTGNDAAYAADTVNASGIDKNTGVNCIDGEAGGLVNSVSDVNAGNIGEISGAAKLAGDSGSASAADIADTAGIAGTTDDTADNAGATDTADAAGAANATGAADISGTAVPGNAGTADPAGKSSGGPESKATTPEKVLLELITIDSNNSNLIIVNKSRSLPADWKPKDLAVLRVPYHGRPEARYMRKEAADALAKLFSKAKKDRIELSAISGFR